MEIHLIRHPLPDVPPGVCYGQADVGLREAAEAAAQRLRPLLPQSYQLHSSPLQRALQLAEALGTPQVDARLMEMNFGEWELQSFHAIGEAIDRWAEDPLGFRAPGGESARDLAARVGAWMEEVLLVDVGSSAPQTAAEPASQVIVAHGGPLRVIAGQLLGLPAQRWIGLDFACGQVSRIDVAAWGSVLKWFNR